MEAEAIAAEAQALAAEIAVAVDAILDATDALRPLADAGDGAAHLSAITLACAVQDIAGQRLARILRLTRGEAASSGPDAHLLNGPATPGAGLDQAAADALFQS